MGPGLARFAPLGGLGFLDRLESCDLVWGPCRVIHRVHQRGLGVCTGLSAPKMFQFFLRSLLSCMQDVLRCGRAVQVGHAQEGRAVGEACSLQRDPHLGEGAGREGGRSGRGGVGGCRAGAQCGLAVPIADASPFAGRGLWGLSCWFFRPRDLGGRRGVGPDLFSRVRSLH